MRREASSRPADRIARVLGWIAAIIVIGAFGFLCSDAAWHGLPRLTWTFLTAPPQDAGRDGGISSVIVSTLLLVAVCLAAAVPLGVLCAVYLAEVTRRNEVWARLVRASLDLLASVPSIVFGLFGMVLFCQVLGLGFSILSGGLTLACMILPIVIRTTEAGFRAVPNELRLAAAALGLTRTATLRHVLLPAAADGVLAGVVLGIGRAMAETAALIFTSGYVARMPSSLLDSGRSLSVHIYDLAMNVPGGMGNAYATTLVLLLLLVGVNAVAIWLTDAWLQGKVDR